MNHELVQLGLSPAWEGEEVALIEDCSYSSVCAKCAAAVLLICCKSFHYAFCFQGDTVSTCSMSLWLNFIFFSVCFCVTQLVNKTSSCIHWRLNLLVCNQQWKLYAVIRVQADTFPFSADFQLIVSVLHNPTRSHCSHPPRRATARREALQRHRPVSDRRQTNSHSFVRKMAHLAVSEPHFLFFQRFFWT